MKRKAQVQMGENVIILFIFFILLVFAIVFFTRIQKTKTQQTVGEDVEAKALQIAQKISFLPEIQCTKENTQIAPDCYDEFSLKALNTLSQQKENQDYYYSLFGASTATVTKIFPEQGGELVIFNNTKDNAASTIATRIPITICDFVSPSRTGQCSFGVLQVAVYS